MMEFGAAERFGMKVRGFPSASRRPLAQSRGWDRAPRLTRLFASHSGCKAALQSSRIAAARRSGNRFDCRAQVIEVRPCGGEMKPGGEAGHEGLRGRHTELGPAPIGSTMSDAFARGLSPSLTMAAVSAPAALAISTRLDQVVASSGL
jgi:hypothetical protein